MLPSTRRCLHLNYQQFTERISILLKEDTLAGTAKRPNVLEVAENQDMDSLTKKKCSL